MSGTMSSTEPENEGQSRDDVIAGEFVLGVLSAKDRASVQARLKSDQAFARKVAHWEQHFSALNDDYAEAAPPAHVFSNIEKRLFEGTAPAKVSLWASLVFWRSLSFASLAIVAGLALFQLGLFTPVPISKPLVARLASENGNINLVALYDDQSGIVKLTRQPPESRRKSRWSCG